VAQRLLKKGYKKVFALKGGWNEWIEAEYPVEKRDPLPEEKPEEETVSGEETPTEDADSEKNPEVKNDASTEE
jgi:3-mercaptopyruvate sulfurtransferase SseA